MISGKRHHFANKGPRSHSYGFSRSHVHMWEVNCKEGQAPKNWCFQTVCWRRLKSWESLGQQGDQISQSWRKSTLNIHCKDWSWNSNTLAMWCEEPTHWKRPWCLERLRARGEGGNRGWNGWMASSTRWTWVWELVINREVRCAAVHGVSKSQTWLSDWTELNLQ